MPQLQRQRRGLPRPRHHGRRLDDLRGVRGPALRLRGARLPLRWSRHQRGPRDAGERGARVLLRRRGTHPCGRRDPRPARRRRPRLRHARPAAHHAVGRRGPAAQARHQHDGQGRHLRARRADRRPAPRRRREPARPARPAGGLGQVGHRDRAPPSGHGSRRLDHRPRPWCRPRRRTGGVRGNAVRPRGIAFDADRRAPRGVRRSPRRRSADRRFGSELSRSAATYHYRIGQAGEGTGGASRTTSAGTGAKKRTTAAAMPSATASRKAGSARRLASCGLEM